MCSFILIVGDEIGKMKLDSKEPYQSTAVPHTTGHIKPLTLSQASHLPSHSTKFQPTTVISGTSSHSTKLPLPEYGYESADSRSLGPQAVRNTTLRQRHHKVSNSNAIPTALVTPLPGTSPPHYSHEGRTCHDHQLVREEVDGEDGNRLKGMGWKLVEGVEDEPCVPLISGDNTIELIEKWKALIDTKDRIMKQKNAQIERYLVYIYTVHVHVHVGVGYMQHPMRELLYIPVSTLSDIWSGRGWYQLKMSSKTDGTCTCRLRVRLCTCMPHQMLPNTCVTINATGMVSLEGEGGARGDPLRNQGNLMYKYI